jgi:RNA polymerase sigma factor (sigma-70 family)
VQHLISGLCLTTYMNDAELTGQILKGNMNAFAFLVNRYQKLVLHISGRVIQRQDDLEDVCQEVFLKVYQNLNKYRNECKLSTWIATIAYNTSINHLRKYRNGDKINSDDTAAFEKLTEFRYDEYEKDDLYRYIREQIDLLPVQYRTVLTLFHLEEFSYPEIVQITGMPEGTVKNYLFRAKALLKEKLKFVVDDNSLKFVEEISNEK